MSHHRRLAQRHLALALDYLVSARDEAESFTGEPNPTSLELDRLLVEVKRALYDVNTAGWVSAEGALQSVIGPLGHIAGALKRQRDQGSGRVLARLILTRKAVRAALLNLRLRKDRPE